MFDLRVRGPHRRGAGRACRRSSADLRDRYDRVAIGDKGAIYNTDLMETVELGFLLDCADTLVAAALARTESRGGHYREDHPLARRRELAEALARLPQRRRLDPPGLQAREDGSLHPDGEEVLMATAAEVLNARTPAGRRRDARARSRSRSRVRRYNPEVSEDSWWDEWHGASATRSTGSSRCCTRSSGTTTAR